MSKKPAVFRADESGNIIIDTSAFFWWDRLICMFFRKHIDHMLWKDDKLYTVCILCGRIDV